MAIKQATNNRFNKKFIKSNSNNKASATIIFFKLLLLTLIGILSLLSWYLYANETSNNININEQYSKKKFFPVEKKEKEIITVGYFISITKCEKKGLLDGAAVLKRSIENNSYPNDQTSRYGYKLYAIIHSKVRCQHTKFPTILRNLGFEVLFKDTPINEPLYHVMRTFRRKDKLPKPEIFSDGCCGETELIKLYMYNFTQHQVVVQLDVDVLYLQPFDILFDAIVFSKDNPIGRNARKFILSNGLVDPTYSYNYLPRNISAFFTRDWCGSEHRYSQYSGLQGGFFVVRPDELVYNRLLDIIREGNYIPGKGEGKGWGGRGYGYQIHGSMTIQGMMAYYYDINATKTSVQLHRCKFNQMTCDQQEEGKCRDGRPDCNDVQCQTSPITDTYSFHFCDCRKPWDCPNTSYWYNDLKEHTCHAMHKQWFTIRKSIDLKNKDDIGHGMYQNQTYLGYCKSDGDNNYIALN